MIYAETIEAPIHETEEDLEPLELPSIKNYLEEGETSEPRFFFTQSRMQGMIEEPIKVTFFSDQEVSEARVTLPNEAKLLKEQLPAGLTAKQGTHSHEWIIQTERVRNTFVLPVVFDSAGNYEVDVEDATATIEVQEPEETSEEVPVEETESSDEDSVGQEDLKEENGIEEDQENEQPAEDVREPVSEVPQEQQIDAEETDEAIEEPTVFDGEKEEVTTMAQFRAAVANPDIGIISVQANLTDSAANILAVDRPLLIQGNGHTLTFDNNGFYFQLAEVIEKSAFRIENVTLTKVGGTPLINATVENSKNWTVELEDITEANANNMRLASLPEGNIHFTGGVSNFTRTASAQTFIEAKEVVVTNQAEITISRGNATVFFSSATVADPKLTVEQGAKVTITTAGAANTIDFGGENPEIDIRTKSQLVVNATGVNTGPSDRANNVISLTGSTPKIMVNSESRLIANATLARRGLHLVGNNAQLIVNDSELSVTSVAYEPLNIIGDSPLFSTENSIVQLVSGNGPRVNLVGDNPVLSLTNTEMTMTSSTARGIYLQGTTPQVILDGSQLVIINTGNGSSGMILQGTDALLSLSNKSEVTVKGVNNVMTDNIQIGNNNARPKLSVSGGSKLFVSTGGHTNGATAVGNNAINLWGADPKATVTGGSELEVLITSNARRGVHLNGSNAELVVDGSQFNVTTVTGNGVTLQGTDALLSLSNKSEVTVNGVGTTTSDNIQIGNNNVRPELSVSSGSKLAVITTSSNNVPTDTFNNAINLRGPEPKLSVIDESEIEIQITSGVRRGVLLSGNNGEAVFRNSGMKNHTNNGDNLRINGDNSAIIVSDKSDLDLKGGNGNNLAIYGDSASLLVNGESSIQAISTGTVQDNNSMEAMIFLGQSHRVKLVENAHVKIDNSEINLTGNIGTGLGLYSNSSKLNLANDARLNISTESNGINGAVRLIEHGNANITLNSSEMNVVQRGTAAAIRVDRQNNKFILEDNSKINAQNVHTNNSTDGTAGTGGSTGSGQQAIQFPEDLTAHKTRLNEFVVSEGSVLQLISLQGPSLDFDGSFGRFDVISGSQIEIVGNPRTASAGIIQSRREIDIEFDNPLFLDLRNNRLQGNIFTVPTGSSLKATNSDLAVWRKGSNLDSDPDLNFPTLDYSFTGTNFNTLGTTNQPEILNTDTFGNTGLASYSRLSSNNARWAIADELRVSTNADKKIHGHISIPVGLDDSRSAWENEATVIVEVKRANGTKTEHTAKTVGHSNDTPGISIYGEEPRGGLFEIDLEEPLEAGAKIRIINVELTSGELTEGFDHQILTDTMEVFPIIPPTPAKFSSSIIGKGSRSIQGYSENKEAEVTAMHNGKQLTTENVVVNKDGTFILNLNDISLEEDDKIQVFLRDSAGLAETAGVINPPETNNNRGNINPSAEFTFRDVTFEPATILTVGDVGQVFPVDPLDPEKEVDPENQPELPENQGQLSVDFVSSFNFGSQPITANDQTYYAQPQRLLNADGTVNETEERPNYVQISDRRPENDRNGWQLAVTQNYPFLATNNRELNGARLRLTNQQLETAQGGSAPEFQQTNPLALVPGNRRILLMAQGTEGTGTWIYRFGDQETANKSVALDVPKGANPEAVRYETTLTWELSAVPGN